MRVSWLGAGALVITSVFAGEGCSTSTSSPSSSREGVGATAQAIQNGTVDSTHTFAVGVCNGTGPTNSGACFSRCSGALILPNVVATARHCVDDTPEVIDCSLNGSFGARKSGAFRVTTNTTMAAAASGWYAVQSIAVPDDDRICGNDIALLVLSTSIPTSVATPITPGVQHLMWDPRYAASFVGIGYGKTSPGTDDSGTRRQSKRISVLCVPGSNSRPCPAAVNAKDFVGGDGTCQGDSGSSAYESDTFTDGTPVSFGVLSRGGQSEDGTKCQGSIYTRFDAHRDFVLSVVQTASNDWTLYPEPSWTAFVAPYTPPSKDAGTKDSSPPTEEPKLDFGERCEEGIQCTSGICSDSGDGTLVCSQFCDVESESSCPEGYECREEVCSPPIATPPPPAATITTTTRGCSAAVRPVGGGEPWGLVSVALAAAGIGVGRRRRR